MSEESNEIRRKLSSGYQSDVVDDLDAAILRHLLRSAETVKQIPFNHRTILSKQEAEEQRSIPWTEIRSIKESK